MEKEGNILGNMPRSGADNSDGIGAALPNADLAGLIQAASSFPRDSGINRQKAKAAP